MGASLALAGLGGCRNKMPEEAIFASPHARVSEGLGEPRYYATTFPMPGFVQGLLVESHEGRPTKIEGNPLHPASLGATGLFAQASILDLYSPDRLKTPMAQNAAGVHEPRDWVELEKLIAHLRTTHHEKKGEGLALLTGEIVSPTLMSQITTLLRLEPKLRWYVHEPVANAKHAHASTFDFSRARRLLSIDCDFLGLERNAVANAAHYANARRERPGRLRLYMIEPSVSITGTKADHRFALSTGEIAEFLDRLAKTLVDAQGSASGPHSGPVSGPWSHEIRALARDLLENRGEAFVLVGFAMPEEIHARAANLNQLLNADPRFWNSPATSLGHENQNARSLSDLRTDLLSGQIETLLILSGNPAYSAPVDLVMAQALTKAKLCVQLTPALNETSVLSHWVIPESHYLETWSDAEAADGTESLVQPLLSPPWASWSAHDFLNALLARGETGYASVRSFWQARLKLDAKRFEAAWQEALENGLWPNQMTHVKTPGPRLKPPPAKPPFPAIDRSGLELNFRPDATVWDGRFSENAWLQELPKPPTQLTWDNALLISPDLAKDQGLETSDVVRVKTTAGAITVAALIVPGLARESLTLSLGYGRVQAGRVGSYRGFDANLLRHSEEPWRAKVLSLEKTGRKFPLAVTQRHHDMGGRELILAMTAGEAMKPRSPELNPDRDIGTGSMIAEAGTDFPRALTNLSEQWAMAIDTDACIGCSVCVIACQAENNIPVVGKNMVLLGREMHWIRIDRYVKLAGSVNDLTAPIPITCMHCETAPCEVVCPVAATNHSSDGLNQMTYNRCVGTRYCSNNCPYKVRRFNFFAFAMKEPASLAPQRNPDVTVRSRGVMEKCTYCVQRIERARIEAMKENRAIRDGEIQTACQQSCPTNAITFGNLRDPASPLHALRSSARTYGLLTELGTRPRTTYLAQIKNPHPDLQRPT
jgi:molybdopterin-containing oxidoreductase family iron-sulfur binding subunit